MSRIVPVVVRTDGREECEDFTFEYIGETDSHYLCIITATRTSAVVNSIVKAVSKKDYWVKLRELGKRERQPVVDESTDLI